MHANTTLFLDSVSRLEITDLTQAEVEKIRTAVTSLVDALPPVETVDETESK